VIAPPDLSATEVSVLKFLFFVTAFGFLKIDNISLTFYIKKALTAPH